MSKLLRTIKTLTCDGFVVSFSNDGYNCNMVTLCKPGLTETSDVPPPHRIVALPEDHLTEDTVAGYLLAMSQDQIFNR